MVNVTKAEKYKIEAIEAAMKGNKKREIKLLKKAIKLNPDDPTLFYNLGVAYQELNLIEDAFNCYLQAIGADPQYAKSYYNLGYIHLETNNYTAAIISFKDFLNTSDELHDKAYSKIAEACAGLGDLDSAIENYKKAVSINPNDQDLLFNFAGMYVNFEKFDEAIPIYQKIIDLNPSDHESYFNLAKIYAMKGEESLMKEMLIYSAKSGNRNAQFKCDEVNWNWREC